MKKLLFGVLFGTLGLAAVGYAASNSFDVKARTFDPAKTFLVASTWLNGIGCPTNASVATYPSTSPTGTYTDPACTTGDPSDKKNQGLLLAKTGPTSNNASGVADLKGVKGTMLTELGYDIRKPRSIADPSGSHCGAGAPRFDIQMTDGSFYFLGCSSPPPTTTVVGQGFLRLRWGGGGTLLAYNASTGALEDISAKTVKAMSIVFDEGTDTGPDNFGLAVLDNIDVNGQLVGHASSGDQGDQGDNGDNGD